MSPKRFPVQGNVIPYLKEKSKCDYGLISINYILINAKMDDLIKLSKKYGITLPDNFITRMDFLKIFTVHLIEMYYSTDIQKFYFLSKLIDDDSMVDERISFVGMYSELLKPEEDELQKIEEANYDAQEEVDALDVDDMEEGDDFFIDNDYDNEIPDSLE